LGLFGFWFLVFGFWFLVFWFFGFLGWRWESGQIHCLGWRRITFPPLRRVTFEKAPKVTKSALLLVGSDFVGFPHSDDAPWALRHPPSMAGGGSRGIHAARPTARRLRLAGTQVAFCGL